MSLNIRNRLLAGFGLMIILIIAMTSWVVISGRETAFLISEVTRTTHNAALVQNFVFNTRNIRVTTYRYLALGDEAALKARDETIQKIEDIFNLTMKTVKSDTAKANMAAMHEATDRLKVDAIALTELKKKGASLTSPEIIAKSAELDLAAKNQNAAADVAAGYFDSQTEKRTEVMKAGLEFAEYSSIGAGDLALVLGVVIALSISRAVATPIQNLTQSMRELADGKINIDVPYLTKTDEIGQMAAALGIFKQNALAKLAADQETERLKAEAERQQQEQLAREREETQTRLARAQRIDALIKSFENDSSSALSALGESAQTLKKVGTDLNMIVAQTQSASSAVAGAAEQASANVQTVSASTEEMAASTKEIAHQIAYSTTATQRAVDAGNQASTMVAELAGMSERISAIVGVISDVAAKTDLLALNATIEAARAGDAGKGFAVVASEVKQLASQTAKATEDIASQVRAIQDATRSTVTTISTVSEAIRSVSEISSAIAAAIDEQSAATNEISRNTQETASATQEVTHKINQVAQMSEHSADAGRSVEKSSAEVIAQTQQLREGVERFITEVRSV
jgi:methyl-accepting chemotaxis protein